MPLNAAKRHFLCAAEITVSPPVVGTVSAQAAPAPGTGCATAAQAGAFRPLPLGRRIFSRLVLWFSLSFFLPPPPRLSQTSYLKFSSSPPSPPSPLSPPQQSFPRHPRSSRPSRSHRHKELSSLFVPLSSVDLTQPRAESRLAPLSARRCVEPAEPSLHPTSHRHSFSSLHPTPPPPPPPDQYGSNNRRA